MSAVTAAEPVVSRPSASDVCRDVVDEWRAPYYADVLFEEETHMISLRVNSWISRNSVVAGVLDVFSASRSIGGPLPLDRIKELGEKLGERLQHDGLLLAQPRRAGMLPS